MTDDQRAEMPPWVRRAILLGAVALAGLFVLYWLIVHLRGLIVMLLVSLFLSFAIEPAVNWLEVRGWRRGVGTMAVFLGLLAIATVFVAAMGSLLVDQVRRFIDEAPGYIEDAELWLEENLDVTIETDDLLDEFREGGAASELATRLAGNLLSFSATVIGILFQVLTIALFTFYLVADGPRLRRVICSALPPDRQREVLRIWELAINKTGGYIYSRALLALLSTAVHWPAFVLIGVPFPLPLALWVGVFSQFIPVIGTYIAGVLPVLIALLEDPVEAAWVLGVIVVYQQFENYVLAPRITAHTMEMHPAVAFGAVVAGAGILGPVGALLALPAAATLQAVVSSYLQRHDVIESSLTDESRRRPNRAGS